MRRATILGLALLLLAALPEAAGAQERFAELAFVSDDRIYSLRADGSGRAPLVAPTARRESLSQPTWSPDGQTLAYVRSVQAGREIGDDDRSQIMLRTASGTTALTPLRKAVSDSAPAWSPDGTKLAFGRYVETKESYISTIRVIARTGGAATVLARASLGRAFSSVSSPSWRPDGHAVAFVRSSLDSKAYFKQATFLVGTGGGTARLLVDKAGPVSWSPDGSRLVYSSIRDRNGQDCGSDECNYRSEIYVSRSDGTAARRLTRSPGEDAQPSWSPDGSRILFTSARNFPEGDGSEIYTMSPDGSCLTWLTNGTPESSTPVWRPAGTGSPAPPLCGDAGRRPLIEVKVGTTPRDALSLGPTHRGLLLSHFEGSRARAFFHYDDCGFFNPRRCPPTGLQVVSESVCRRDAFSGALETGFPIRRRRGALVSYYGEEGGLDIYSGLAATSVHTELTLRGRRGRREYERTFPSLVRVGRADRPGGRLPAPRISQKVARQLRAAERAKRGRPLRAAARSLRLSRDKLRNWLRFARALRGAGGIRPARCPR